MRTILGIYATAFGLLAMAQNGEVSGAVHGKVLFTKVGCYQCHGYAGQGGRAGARIVPMELKVQDMIRYVRRPPGEMPAYTEKVLSDADLTDIHAYLMSFPPPKQLKDIQLLNDLKNRR